MKLLHWCMLGVTILLLVCEVTTSQLCKSLITLVDGFHTLFILFRMAFAPQTANIMLPPLSSLESPASPPPASSSSSAASTSTLPAESSIRSPPGSMTNGSLDCGVSYTSSRIEPVGSFISALLLISLCLSYFMEIISCSLEPHPVQRPLLLVAVGAVSLLHKMLVVWLNWDQLQAKTPGVYRHSETESHLEGNPKVLDAEESKSQAEQVGVLDEVSLVQSAVEDSLHNGTLVLCNPGTSSIPDTETSQQAEVHQHAAATLRDSRYCRAAGGAADLEVCKYESRSEDISKDNICMGSLDRQNASETSPVCKSSHHIENTVLRSQCPIRFLTAVLVTQGLCTSLLALINSLVMLLISPQWLQSSGTCGLILYLDPGLSLLGVMMLIATAAPQVQRYGLLLLQVTPPHISVSDLGRRITSVPGVQAVHHLHVWQLTESLMVASVHVHCHAGFPVHRCADLMLGVTKVLQSVGVSCCTVQPEFASCSGSPVAGGRDPAPVIHREDPSLPPLLTCRLACGKACAGNMCCSPLEEESRGPLAPAAGELKEEPQTLVIENTFI